MFRSGDKIKSRTFQKDFGENHICQLKCPFCNVNVNILDWEHHKLPNFIWKSDIDFDFFGRSMLPNIGNRNSIRQGKNHSKTRWTKKTGNKVKQMRKRKSISLEKMTKKQFWKSEEKMRTALLLIVLKAKRRLDRNDKEAKMIARNKIKPKKVNFHVIRTFFIKASTKKKHRILGCFRKQAFEKTYNYNFPLNKNTLNGKSNQKTVYAR